jgi:hypothetical protein
MEFNMGNQYINGATAALVTDLRGLISKNALFADDPAVIDAFSEFSQTCATTPSVVRYLSDKLAKSSNTPCFKERQIEILMLGVIARSSSTYGTIPNVVAHLALIGEHADAAILNENAKNETGDREHTPHPTLLFDCFKIIGEALSIDYLTPASYHILRYILIEREKAGGPGLQSIDSIKEHILRGEPHFPPYGEKDIEVALHYSNLCKSDITQLHSSIVRIESRMDDRTVLATARNPYDKRWLATRRLELALREATSVDEHETGRLSYIGAWGNVVESLIPQIPPGGYDRARAWTRAHNDEVVGQAVGWSGAAEEGHAMDARIQAIQMVSSLKPTTFASVLREVAALNNMRLAFWDDIVEELAALERFPNDLNRMDSQSVRDERVCRH